MHIACGCMAISHLLCSLLRRRAILVRQYQGQRRIACREVVLLQTIRSDRELGCKKNLIFNIIMRQSSKAYGNSHRCRNCGVEASNIQTRYVKHMKERSPGGLLSATWAIVTPSSLPWFRQAQCFTLRINRKTRRPATRADLIPTHAEHAYNTLDIVLFLSSVVLASARDQVMLAL